MTPDFHLTYTKYFLVDLSLKPRDLLVKPINLSVLMCKRYFHCSVKGITSTSYFSVHFKNTIFWMMEGKLRVTVLNSVKRKINLLKNGGYFTLTPSNDLNTVPPLITRYSHSFFSVFSFSLLFLYRPIIRFTMTV